VKITSPSGLTVLLGLASPKRPIIEPSGGSFMDCSTWTVALAGGFSTGFNRLEKQEVQLAS
jgi:hypothetical protein